MPTARVLWATRLAAGAGLACCLLLTFLATATAALSQEGPVTSHWEQNPAPLEPLRWFPLYDNEVFFCLEDRAGVGVGDAWIQDNLSLRWGVKARPWCVAGVTPDLRIIIEDFAAPQPAGWARVDMPTNQWNWLGLRFYQHCQISLNAAIFWQRGSYVWPGTSTWLPDVPQKTFLHEFGHCIGLGHRQEPGYQGAMYPMMLYYPSEEEVAALHHDYDPWLLWQWLLERLLRPVAWAIGLPA